VHSIRNCKSWSITFLSLVGVMQKRYYESVVELWPLTFTIPVLDAKYNAMQQFLQSSCMCMQFDIAYCKAIACRKWSSFAVVSVRTRTFPVIKV